jgi:hypothetical protein
MPPTLILSPRHTDDNQALWRTAVAMGWDVERLPGWRVPEHLRGLAEPILYVEPLLAPVIAPEFGVTLAEPPEDWLPRLPVEYLLRSVRLASLDEARRLTVPTFVKPPNDKSFEARVVATGADFPAWVDSPRVLLSEPVRWEREFRCFVAGRRVAVFSVYLRDGVLQRDAGFASDEAEDAELTDFMSRLLSDPRVELPDAVVIDAGVIAGRGWAVVEANAAWGAGIYGCDPRAALEVIRRSQAKVS